MLLVWGMIFMMTGCSEQKNSAADVGKASQTDKVDTSNDQGALSGQESGGEALQFENTDANTREAASKYPIITEIDAQWVDYVMDSEGIYCVYVDDRYGFLTDAGEETTPFIYEEAAPFNEDLACVCLDGKYGYIDKNGITALEFIYDYAAPFVEGLAYFNIEDSYGFMDKNGEPVFYLNCDSVSSFQEGLA